MRAMEQFSASNPAFRIDSTGVMPEPPAERDIVRCAVLSLAGSTNRPSGGRTSMV